MLPVKPDIKFCATSSFSKVSICVVGSNLFSNVSTLKTVLQCLHIQTDEFSNGSGLTWMDSKNAPKYTSVHLKIN